MDRQFLSSVNYNKLINSDRYSDDELIAFGKLIGVYGGKSDTMASLRQKLKTKFKEFACLTIFDTFTMTFPDIHSTCINEDEYDLLTVEPIREISEDRLLQIPAPPQKGYCYDAEALIQHLRSSKKNEHFDRTVAPTIWKDRKEFDLIINHPTVDSATRQELIDIFYPARTVQQVIEDYILENYKTFEIIGIETLVIDNDTNAYKFFPDAAEAIARISAAWSDTPLINLEDKVTNTKLGHLLGESSKECIHVFANRLATIYLYNFFELRKQHPQLKLLDQFIELNLGKESRSGVVVFSYFTNLVGFGPGIIIVLYIHPDPDSKIPSKRRLFINRMFRYPLAYQQLIPYNDISLDPPNIINAYAMYRQHPPEDYLFWYNIHTATEAVIPRLKQFHQGKK